MKRTWNMFWRWYERHYLFNLSLAAGLFILQGLHLVWLLFDVIIPQLGGPSFFPIHGILLWALIFVDFTEIPALISVSLLYIHELHTKFSLRPVWYLIALNVQWLHLFWITDEFVISSFEEGQTVLPLWLAWIAILIDYAEVPVMFATVKKLLTALKENPRTLSAVFLEQD